MAYPPTPPPNNRTNATPLPTNHIGDHNDISNALTDIVNELGSDPKGSFGSVTARLDDELGAQTSRLECQLTHSVGQSITSGLGTALTFDTETSDVGGLHSAGSPTRITIPAAGGGLWMFTYALTFSPNATGDRTAWLAKNGSASDRRAVTSCDALALLAATLAATHVVRMADADYMVLAVEQTSGGALNVQGANSAVGVLQFAAVRLGD